MTRRLVLALAALVVLAAACATAASPKPSPSPTPGPALSVTDLKLVLVGTYGPLWFCDPDFFPIQRQDEIKSARERWAEVTADRVAYAAIATFNRIDPEGSLTDAQRLAIYRSWKMLQAVALDPIGNDTYRFDYLAKPAQVDGTEGTRTAGTIRSDGAISVEQKAAATEPICPICLARGTLVQGPGGGIAVEMLRIGDRVWTMDGSGRRVPGVVIALGSTTAPVNHHVVRLTLSDGRSVTASPGHPLADGRLIGDLRPGDIVDGAPVAAVDLLAYTGGSTFDLIVSGETGAYLVDGIALGTTLRP